MRIVHASVVLAGVTFGVAVFHMARVDYAHRTREPGADMCGPGLVTCPDGERCAFDDYSYVLPIGHCEQPCEREFTTCSRTSAPRQCRFDGDTDALECVRVLDSYR